MGLSNVEVVRDQYEATNERDWERAMSHYADEVVLVVHGEGIRTGTFEGREATGDWFGDFFSSFDRDGHFEIAQISELEDGRVALFADYRARGRTSGVEVSGTVAWLYSFRDGKIVRLEGSTDFTSGMTSPAQAIERLRAQAEAGE
ncbi:MAG: nuclear transport factor 2 family protein [Solirubrobacterales bacterium]